jgi:hypothetical protein
MNPGISQWHRQQKLTGSGALLLLLFKEGNGNMQATHTGYQAAAETGRQPARQAGRQAAGRQERKKAGKEEGRQQNWSLPVTPAKLAVTGILMAIPLRGRARRSRVGGVAGTCCILGVVVLILRTVSIQRGQHLPFFSSFLLLCVCPEFQLF